MSEIPKYLTEKRTSDSKWLNEQGWRFNPFIGEEIHLSDPRMFAGYKEELRQAVTNIDDLINVFIVGSYGVGKSTFLSYLLEGLPNDEFKTSFTVKPSSVKAFFSDILSNLGSEPRPNDTIGGLFSHVIYTIRELGKRGIKCTIVVDEVADSTVSIMRWLRVLSDENISLVFGGYPKTPSILRDRFFPLYDRMFKTIELKGLTNPDIIEFLSRRIRVASFDADWDRSFVEDISPFELEAVDILQDESGGAPRYLLRSCYDAIRLLITNEKHFIDAITLKKLLEDKSKSTFNTLTRRQLEVAEILFRRGSLPSSEIGKTLGVSTAAVDSLLKPLEKVEIIRKVGKRKGYEYALTPMAERYYAREEST